MRYGIVRLVLGSKDFLEISQEDYSRYCAAKEGIVSALQIEEKMEIVLQNYVELESTLLDIVLKDTVFWDFDWSRGREQVHEINRRVINLLSSTRLYIDQVDHDLKQTYGAASRERKTFERRKSEVYDSRLAYRAMELLRNHVQHHGLPIDTYNPSQYTAESTGNEDSYRRTITPTLSLEELKKNKRLKKNVLRELEESRGEGIDLKMLLRGYIDGLGEVHLTVRDLIEEDAAKWEGALAEVSERFLRETGATKTTGLAIVSAADKRLIYSESEEIFDDIGERRRKLVRKNSFLNSFSSIFVSSEPGTSR